MECDLILDMVLFCVMLVNRKRVFLSTTVSVSC